MNILNFNSVDDYVPDIKPAKIHVPDWYKKIKGYNKGNLVFKNNENSPYLNIKSCVPFFDSLNIGYIIELKMDLYVEIKNKKTIIHWRGSPDPIGDRPVEENIIPTPPGCSNTHFIWKNQYILSAKKGYSAIVTHPLNRFDLPFITLTGIIDLDYLVGPGNIPFYIKDNFVGLIPAGTPIIQILPFKRESWKIKKDKNLIEKNKIEYEKSFSSMIGWYKNNRWNKKEFN